ncbi:MAG: hypothetical protein LBD94_01195 [Rickettsiales bacterium]|jgi:hypothetical protein|nr:hypothetical protein [Rickettsiales bacterium]
MNGAGIVIDMDSSEYKSGHRKGSIAVTHAVKQGARLEDMDLPQMQSGDNINRYYGYKDGFCGAIARLKELKKIYRKVGENRSGMRNFHKKKVRGRNR